MKKYIYYTTLLAVFSESFVTNYVIDIKLFYFVILTNFVLIGFISKLYINLYLGLFYLFLLANGLITVYLGTNSMALFGYQFLGIAIVSLYFFNFFVVFKDNLQEIFRDYTYLSFSLAVLGIAIFIFNALAATPAPLKSIMLEPAHYATIVLPAFYYSLKKRRFPRFIWKIILVSILLSGSSLGFLGLGLAIVLIPDRIRIYKLVAGIVIAGVLFYVAYNNYEQLKIRTDDTAKAIVSRNLENTNLSTFFLTSNFFIALKSVETNPLLGSGLGSHELSHEKYISTLKGSEKFREFFHINSKDAASLAIRVLSDLGITGILVVIAFMVSNYVGSTKKDYLITRAVLIYFFCKFLREGHYFPPEFYFFIFAYYFVSRLAKEQATPPKEFAPENTPNTHRE